MPEASTTMTRGKDRRVCFPISRKVGSASSLESNAFKIAAVAGVCWMLMPQSALGYIGPGAGFAVGSSAVALFLALVSGAATIFLWPVRWFTRWLRSRRALAHARVKRVVILGLDGMEPTLAEQYMAEGRMPNLARLAAQGTFSRLATTAPPLSPVAWSTFTTGCNPGKHNIFDFLTRDKRSYLPLLSSVSIRPASRTLKLGKYRIPLGKPDIRLQRKGRPFWNTLGDHGIFSNIIRVPITFPPERFRGVLLSAMCVPDLRGTQGTFSYYTTRNADGEEYIGGEQIHVRREGNIIRSHLIGPDDGGNEHQGPLRCRFEVDITGRGQATLNLCGQTIKLKQGEYTPWIHVEFKAGLGITVKGICEFLLQETEPEFRLYVTPIQIDPDRPAMPISHPAVYANYLAKNQGAYATLGLAEDTWGLNAKFLSDDDFLHQCLEADSEREKMFFDALEKVRRGLCVCVFDGTDRIQHMFWRYLDPEHPAHAGQAQPQHRNAIEELYARMDGLVGRTMAKCQDDGTILLVISDHGFNPFRRGIDLNVWLEQNGYLTLKPGGRGRKYLGGVDWSRTKAYGLGLAGIWLNIQGREAQGVVPAEEADALRDELCKKLTGLRDDENGQVGINRALNAHQIYRGPYRKEGPDLIIGYNRGYRVSWEAAIGQPTDRVFHDNTKAWSGDHCVDPRLIPGVLFCNRKIGNDDPRLMDLGPTVLDLFGVPVPGHMDGKPLMVADGDRAFPRNGHLGEPPASTGAEPRSHGSTKARNGAMIVAFVLAMVSMTSAVSGSESGGSQRRKVIVLGFDGMDPRLCERLMDAGELPNLAAMRDAGGYKPLGTSIPPQSPVAWASFITGAGPGVHGIFDFIHRDPARQCAYYYSAADTVPGEGGWDVGEHLIPLTFWPFNHRPAQTSLRRGGIPFWDYLDKAGVAVRIYEIPANYPPSPSHHGHMCCLSGMGVPDLLGGFGTYQYFSEDLRTPVSEGGGLREPLRFQNHAASATLVGPRNTYRKKPVDARVEFRIYRHPTEPTARIDVQDQTILLREGEWSEWCKLDYALDMPPFLPRVHAKGICRFYVQSVHPRFRLYVTPINIDPSDPGGQKISEPEAFVTRIADHLGLFHTTGFQEDHKALSNGIFNDEEFLRQATHVLDERMSLLRYATADFADGLLFFYFSSTDLQAHMFWWDSVDPHPVRSAVEARKYNGVIEELYKSMDRVIGDIVARYGAEATILVMSDHGFCNFRRQFNLNTWLRDNGYLAPSDCKSLLNPRRGRLVDWSKTRGYGLGLNGLYLNLQGRERDGIVSAADRGALLDELTRKLMDIRDPLDDKPVIAEVYRADEVYSGPHAAEAPDLIVGYHRGYRASWGTTLGDVEEQVIFKNDSAWSADHCIAAGLVPGVVFSNKPIVREAPSLVDLAPTILEEFGVSPPPAMIGGSLFAKEIGKD